MIFSIKFKLERIWNMSSKLILMFKRMRKNKYLPRPKKSNVRLKRGQINNN